MTFGELRASIDARLEVEPRLHGSRRELTGDRCVWALNQEAVAFSSSGSTGILVQYLSNDRLMRSKIFAASPMSVERIVTSAAEHLTGYVFHRTPAVP